jgi:AcrR family transcriptional regulator
VPRLRPERLDERRQAILAGARQAFARYGYEGATVRLLEQQTGLSRGAIFHHFPDKDALFLALAEQDAAEMADVVAERGLVQVMRDLRTADPGWLGVQLEVARRIRTDPEFLARWQAHLRRIEAATVARLKRQQEAGIVRADLSAERLAEFLQLVLDGLIYHCATGMTPAERDGLLDIVEQAVRKDAEATAPLPAGRAEKETS